MVGKACCKGGRVKGGKSRLKVERVEKLMVARACLKGGRVKGGIIISGPEPSKIEVQGLQNRVQETSWPPLGPSWQQRLKKRDLKVPQETPRRPQTPPTTLPKPPKID